MSWPTHETQWRVLIGAAAMLDERLRDCAKDVEVYHRRRNDRIHVYQGGEPFAPCKEAVEALELIFMQMPEMPDLRGPVDRSAPGAVRRTPAWHAASSPEARLAYRRSAPGSATARAALAASEELGREAARASLEAFLTWTNSR